ncbi:MFS transporter [Metabacillus idriensis]|uniref:MFS transporter n=1 Tax=Metabacillus idriensis TaxID=324768 RepID=UPI003D28A6E0
MKNDSFRKFIAAQSTLFFAGNFIFPFYLLFVKNIGSSYSQFGISYGLFGLSAALVHPLLGRMSGKVSDKEMLSVSSFGMALILLYYPHIGTIEEVYVCQMIMGLFGAMQKHGEKMLLTQWTTEEKRGMQVGTYHFFTSLMSAAAIMGGGFLAQYFTITYLFFIASAVYFSGGLIVLRITDSYFEKEQKVAQHADSASSHHEA